MVEVRRDDGELCGEVVVVDGRWVARSVFGGVLGEHDTEADAERQVRGEGLAALSERWVLVDRDTGDEEVVCIVEAHPGEVILALGYYSMPGVPTRTLTADELGAGRWELCRHDPSA